jgi:hypothetical protein
MSVDPVIRTYAELVAALREHRLALGLSQLECDCRSGLQNGYVGKLECWQSPHGRGMSMKSLDGVLGVLGLGILLVPIAAVEPGKIENRNKLVSANRRRRKSAPRSQTTQTEMEASKCLV